MNYIRSLMEFHEEFDHRIGAKPACPPTGDGTSLLRERLMKEELAELCSAMFAEDLVAIADGLADLLYVTFGTAVSYGIPIDEVFAIVHRANMAKNGGGKDAGGKTTKPVGWRPPEPAIKELLEEKI